MVYRTQLKWLSSICWSQCIICLCLERRWVLVSEKEEKMHSRTKSLGWMMDYIWSSYKQLHCQEGILKKWNWASIYIMTGCAFIFLHLPDSSSSYFTEKQYRIITTISWFSPNVSFKWSWGCFPLCPCLIFYFYVLLPELFFWGLRYELAKVKRKEM